MRRFFVFLFMTAMIPSFAFAGKKALIWDDAETVGKSNLQVENYFTYTKNKEEKEGEYVFNFTYGYNDKTDLAINVPFGFKYLNSDKDEKFDIADPFVEIKYRFFEKENIKFSLKPFLGIPVSKNSGFSEKNISYGVTLTSQIDLDKLAFYTNSTFTVHENTLSDKNEFFQSVSGEYKINENLSAVLSFYLSNYQSETEKGGLIGIGYSIGKLEIGIGIGKKFTNENNFEFYSGLTLRFYWYNILIEIKS